MRLLQAWLQGSMLTTSRHSVIRFLRHAPLVCSGVHGNTVA